MNLKNKSRTSFVANLEPGADYGNDPRCKSYVHKVRRPVVMPDGKIGEERIEKTLPGSLTWQPGEVKRDLPDAVKDAPQVKAVLARVLVVVE